MSVYTTPRLSNLAGCPICGTVFDRDVGHECMTDLEARWSEFLDRVNRTLQGGDR